MDNGLADEFSLMICSSDLRILLVSPLPPPYGGISHWTRMIQRCASTRSDLSLRVLDIAPRWRALHDISVLKRTIGGGLQLLRDFTFLLLLIATWRPHAIHLTTPGRMGLVRDLFMLYAARLFRIPSIYHIRFGRVPDLLRSKRGFESIFLKLALRLADHIIAIDTRTHESILEWREGASAFLIPNCYDRTELPPAQAEIERTVVFIGWIIPAKGVEELLEAWRVSAAPGWNLALIGPGDPAYVGRIIKGHDKSSVVWLGQLSHADAMNKLASASVLVLPSHTEGFPNVILEAMALGRAIVATPVGAIPEMLAEGAGLLVQPKCVVELAAALKKIQEDSGLRTELGKHAQHRAEALYSLPAVFSSYESIWRSSRRR